MSRVWYQTNFEKGDKGNYFPYGKKHLIIKIPEAKWVTGTLAIMNESNGLYQVIQAEQSGTPNNPWKDAIVFEMVKRGDNGQIVPMGPGDYKITVRAEKNSVIGVEDEFYIK